MAKIKGEMEQYIVYKHEIANDHKESWQNASQALDQQRNRANLEKNKNKKENEYMPCGQTKIFALTELD